MIIHIYRLFSKPNEKKKELCNKIMHFLNNLKMNINNRLVNEYVLQKQKKVTDKDNHLYLPFNMNK